MAGEDDRALSRAFIRSHPPQAARVLEALPPEEAAAIFDRVPARLVAGVLAAMLPQAAARCLAAVADERALELLEPMGTLATVAVLRHVPEPRRQRLVAGLPTAAALASTLIMGYTEDTVGAWADPDVVMLAAEMRAGDALERVRLAHSTCAQVFACDAERRLVGIVDLAALLRAPDGVTLASLMTPAACALPAHATLDAAQAYPGWESESALPVVESHDRLVGVISRAALTHARRAAEAPRAAEEGGSLPMLVTRGYWQTLAGLVECGLALLPRVPAAMTDRDEH